MKETKPDGSDEPKDELAGEIAEELGNRFESVKTADEKGLEDIAALLNKLDEELNHHPDPVALLECDGVMRCKIAEHRRNLETRRTTINNLQ